MSSFFNKIGNNSFIRGFTCGVGSYSLMSYATTSIDKDKNGIDSKDIKTKINEKFEQYDTNKDNKITPGELLDGIINDLQFIKNVMNNGPSDNDKSSETPPIVIFTKNDQQ
jgi:hypothetical protein